MLINRYIPPIAPATAGKFTYDDEELAKNTNIPAGSKAAMIPVDSSIPPFAAKVSPIPGEPFSLSVEPEDPFPGNTSKKYFQAAYFLRSCNYV